MHSFMRYRILLYYNIYMSNGLHYEELHTFKCISDTPCLCVCVVIFAQKEVLRSNAAVVVNQRRIHVCMYVYLTREL